MMSDSEDLNIREVYPPRPTSAPHKVRPTRSIDDVPILCKSQKRIGNNEYVVRDTTNNTNRKRHVKRPLSSKGRYRQQPPPNRTNTDKQLRESEYNYQVTSDSISDASSLKSYRSRRSVSSARSNRSNKSNRSNRSNSSGRRRRYRSSSSAGIHRNNRPSDSRGSRAVGRRYVVPSGVGHENHVEVEDVPTTNNVDCGNDNNDDLNQNNKLKVDRIKKSAGKMWKKLRMAVQSTETIKKRSIKKSNTEFHQPLELTYQDETKSLSYQYELSRLFEIHHKRMVSVENCLDSSGDPLALQWRARANKDREKDRAKGFDIPRTLKMRASYEQIRIWKNRLGSYINRIQHVKSHIDTKSAPASSYLSLMQAARRKDYVKRTSSRRYKLKHAKRLRRLENDWNNRTTLL
eukprot:g313.t1